MAYRLENTSAVPLALPGQVVLGGKIVRPNELEALKGGLVAIDTSDGEFFKRIAGVLPKARHIRQFESIGGLGDSLLVRTEQIADKLGDLPELNSMRQVVGVIYDHGVR